MAYEVIVSGHLCADLIPDTSHTPLSAFSSPGKLYEVGPVTIATGGSVSNTGLALHRLGVGVGLMTTVGDDLLGRVIIARVNDRDPQLGDLIKVRDNEASSYSVILSPENTDRIILHCFGNNAHFDIADVNFDIVRDAKLFHLGYPPLLPCLYANDGDSLVQIYQRVHDMGVITSLDMSHPDPGGPSGQVNWSQVLAKTLPYVDIFLPSIEEIVFMLRRADYDRWDGAVLDHITRTYLRDLGDDLLALGVTIAGFKLGEYGFYLKTAGDDGDYSRLQSLGLDVVQWRTLDLWHPAFAVDVVATTGAGDCAYAGFLAALLHGLSPDDALRFTCAVGAANVESADATSGVLSWDDTQARITQGWDTSVLALPD